MSIYKNLSPEAQACLSLDPPIALSPNTILVHLAAMSHSEEFKKDAADRIEEEGLKPLALRSHTSEINEVLNRPNGVYFQPRQNVSYGRGDCHEGMIFEVRLGDLDQDKVFVGDLTAAEFVNFRKLGMVNPGCEKMVDEIIAKHNVVPLSKYGNDVANVEIIFTGEIPPNLLTRKWSE